ncbi:sensor histidine kinase [Candidatus Marinarcus aquaticus]|uniref:histidine kinase n=1 Tax=Candidatus Marinarcus aquaticus TaxID=2044504 RepID=A0A4Q0XVD4_9BACT|nr:ATP-binding protein [Candidatus Marinarcus aquaticus]RXJ58143.1 two-component sensor histidine kinase [Candidatus Marinarcus aquaticus]
MRKLSIKRKLLIYNIIIQLLILIAFSFSLYKTLQISTLDKVESTLKVIVLDILDDVIEHKEEIEQRAFDEEKEYRFEPLHIRLAQIDEGFKVIQETNFGLTLHNDLEKLKALKQDVIYFEEYETILVSRIRFVMDEKNYVIEVATNYDYLNSTMENLFYILLFIVPIILIFSIIGGYFLIYKSLLPIEMMLKNLKQISASSLSKRLETSNNNDEIDQLAHEINSLLTRLEISFEKISQFSSDASHELKTPLTIIRGEIEVALRKERTPQEYIQTLQSSLDEILIIQQTVDDLLFLAKNESDLHYDEIIYLDEISLESIKELSCLAELKKVELEADIKMPLQVFGHSKLLKIALKNLLKNAINFSFENQKVIVKNYSDEAFIYLEVEDFGIGIKKEEQKKIFEKFYRTDKSRNKDSGGTGLGMAIVEKIIHIHEASIEVKSEENKGTTMTIKFKKAKEDA